MKSINKYIHDVKKNGYVIIENYFSKDICKQLRLLIDQSIIKNPNLYSVNSTDNRMFGFEFYSEVNKFIYNNSFFLEILKQLYKTKNIEGTILGQKLKGSKQNDGSAGHWHRDSVFKQFKIFVYLNDIKNNGGPFQFFPKSNTFPLKLKIALKSNMNWKKLHFDKNLDIKNFLNIKSDLRSVICPEGTVLIADTSVIHRGKPNCEIDRYSFTYYAYKKIPPHIKKLSVKNFHYLSEN